MGKKILVIHIPTDHLEFLSHKGLIPVQTISWRKESIHRNPLKDLICTALNVPSANVTLSSTAFGNDLDPDFLENGQLFDYFKTLFAWAYSKATTEFTKTNIKNVFIALNLMPFSTSNSVADKVVRGIRLYIESFTKRPSLQILLLVRNRASFVDSAFFKDTVGREEYSIDFWVIDYLGYASRGLSTQLVKLPRDLFKQILVQDYKWYYKKLVFGTNAYIGHFVLPHSHVRTHYDLLHFLREDTVFESIDSEINKLIRQFSTVTIIYDGIERVALQRLCSELHTRNSEKIVDYIFLKDGLTREDVLGTDGILLLTDIVNTGHSLYHMRQRVEELLNIKDNIVCYAISAMQNSPAKDCVVEFQPFSRIKRTYYTEENCVLCTMNQPSIRVEKSDDFKKISKDQLTPYDFWEMVSDCSALKSREREASGRTLSFRVETKDIVEKYGYWLRNLILARYEESLPSRYPTKLLTVYEAGGLSFSRLVARALDMSGSTIQSVQRSELEHFMLTTTSVQKIMWSGERVLLVDDGINEGSTMKMLANYSVKHGADPLGAIVLDNRLKLDDLDNLKTDIGRAPIISLYSWPGQVTHY